MWPGNRWSFWTPALMTGHCDPASYTMSIPLTVRPIHTPTLLRSVSLSMTPVFGHVTMEPHTCHLSKSGSTP